MEKSTIVIYGFSFTNLTINSYTAVDINRQELSKNQDQFDLNSSNYTVIGCEFKKKTD